MPYPGEAAGKTGHSEILSNPEVQSFLESCAKVPVPQAKDFSELSCGFKEYSVESSKGKLPELILAIDGSTYEASVDTKAPSRKIGYIKISTVILDFEAFLKLKGPNSRFIDPFEVNRLKRDTSALSFALPGAYLAVHPGEEPRDSFRRRIFECYSGDQTKLSGGQSLTDTLYELCRLTGRVSVKGGEEHIRVLEKCPGSLKTGEQCDEKDVLLPIKTGQTVCQKCCTTIYMTDCLRIHEAFVGHGQNIEALNRLMSVTEHILVAHYLINYASIALDVLSKMCFIIDGPLAVFGPAAWIHRALLILLLNVNKKLKACGMPSTLVLGFQKTGRLREHLDEIAQLIPKHRCFMPITDEYRYSFIDPGKKGTTKNFGDETYYGQDFFVKTGTDKTFVLVMPYLFGDKGTPNFNKAKTELSNYPDLLRVLTMMEKLESVMYGGSIVPVMLAHGNASISIVPGGRVLDIASRIAVKGKGNN